MIIFIYIHDYNDSLKFISDMTEKIEEELKGLTGDEEKEDKNHQLTGNLIIIMEKPFNLSLGPNCNSSFI